MKRLLVIALLLAGACKEKPVDAEETGPQDVTDGIVVEANNDGFVNLYYPADEHIYIPDGANLARFRAKLVEAYHELDIDVTFSGNSWFAEQPESDVFCKDPWNLEHNSLCASYYVPGGNQCPQ